MKIFSLTLVMCALYIMGVVCQQQQPVIVEVPGVLGKYGGYYLGAAVLLLAYINSKTTADTGPTFVINGQSMTAPSGGGGGGGPTPIG